MFGNKTSTTSNNALRTDSLIESGLDENDLICPICQEIMIDPVVAADGHSYERSQIERWLLQSDISPKTGATLPNKNLTTNFVLRSICRGIRLARGLPTELPTTAAQPATISTLQVSTTLPSYTAATTRSRAQENSSQSSQDEVPFESRIDICVQPFASTDPRITVPRTPYVLDHCNKEIKRFSSLEEVRTFIEFLNTHGTANTLQQIRMHYPRFDNASIAAFINFIATTCYNLETLHIEGSPAVTEIKVPHFMKLENLKLSGHCNLKTFRILGDMPALTHLNLSRCGGGPDARGAPRFNERDYPGYGNNARIGTLKFNAMEIFANCPRMRYYITLSNAAVDPECFVQAYEQGLARYTAWWIQNQRHQHGP